MADIEELLTDTPVRLAPAAAVRARGDRRRTRRRAAVAVVAVVAAGAMGFGAWAGLVLPEGSGGGGTEVASAGSNPFMSDGVVRTPDPAELLANEVLHWRAVHPESDDEAEADPLPEVGPGNTCGAWSGDADKPEQQFTSVYTGKDGARARYRVSQYATRAAAAVAMKELDTTLVNCGVEKAVGEPDGEYTGVAEDTGDRLDVTVRSWGAWVAVQEIQLPPVESND
ncbi:hypothetical protein [Streptomyces cyaneofuscatus]|uniref:hypothetical protein n=1 Tax=Streptomyces cyaneofuscatus TaxID=66883 RepID=UPI00364D21D2